MFFTVVYRFYCFFIVNSISFFPCVPPAEFTQPLLLSLIFLLLHIKFHYFLHLHDANMKK